jgi:excinuclease ABC subunit A
MADSQRARLLESLELAAREGEGEVLILDADADKTTSFSEKAGCECGFSLPKISLQLLSFNSPVGACPECQGLGEKLELDPALLIPNEDLTIAEGAIQPWANRMDGWTGQTLRQLGEQLGFSVDTPWRELPDWAKKIVLNGPEGGGKIRVEKGKESYGIEVNFEGVIPREMRLWRESSSEGARKKIEKYMRTQICPACRGQRLNEAARALRIAEKNLPEIAELPISEAVEFFEELAEGKKLSTEERKIAAPIFREISTRLGFLEEVGLGYLTLARSSRTLSGGEAQRIRLATQIGSQLQGVLYVLDEPSIGLHPRDNARLIATLQKLRDLGNTVIVVEHDEEMMRAADFLVEIGPAAGDAGGEVVAAGTPAEFLKSKESVTAAFLRGERKVEV